MATIAAPSAASVQPNQPSDIARAEPASVHNRPAIAKNHTSTDRSTCTTSATWKKSTPGSIRFSPGVRAPTSSSANRPDPTSAAVASASQAPASRRRSSIGTASS